MRAIVALVALLVVIPAIEIALFIRIGAHIGALATVVLTFLTAAIGILLVRLQGFSTLARLQAAMFGQGDPLREVMAGALLLIAGILLLVPGFFTDALGFLLLISPLRRALARWLAPAPAASRRATVIEAEIIEVHDVDDPPNRQLPRK